MYECMYVSMLVFLDLIVRFSQKTYNEVYENQASPETDRFSQAEV